MKKILPLGNIADFETFTNKFFLLLEACFYALSIASKQELAIGILCWPYGWVLCHSSFNRHHFCIQKWVVKCLPSLTDSVYPKKWWAFVNYGSNRAIYIDKISFFTFIIRTDYYFKNIIYLFISFYCDKCTKNILKYKLYVLANVLYAKKLAYTFKQISNLLTNVKNLIKRKLFTV